MRFLGVLLIIIGVGSSLLFLLDMNFLFFQWINRWGTDIGWIIRGGVVVLGIILFILGKPSGEE